MLKVTAGARLLPDSNWEFGSTGLRYQGDGNLVLYMRGQIVWATNAFAPAGVVVMQEDGNLVAYSASGAPYWASETPGVFGAWLEIDNDGMRLVGPSLVWEPAIVAPPPDPPIGPILDRVVRPLVGITRVVGASFGDDTGPRLVHGCTDFGAVVKFKENRDKALRELDVVARYQQFIRAAWRLNGWLWTTSGLTLDPTRDAWYDEAMFGFLTACHERELRVNLTCADMNNWSARQAEESIARVAQIAARVSPTVVILHEWNEIRGTSPGGEGDVDQLRALTRVWQQHYPWSLRGLSDPGTQDGPGMRRLGGDPANVHLIHEVRWSAEDAIRRTFNSRYEGADKVVQGEPTGPNGSVGAGQFTRKVYQPTENPDDLFAIYTQQVLTGQISTYFNDPALVSREPLDSTWGFKELPRLWQEMEIPENIGQQPPMPGHRSGALLQVVGSNAHRADGAGDFAIVSGGDRWQIKTRRAGVASGWRASGKVWERRVSEGEMLPESGPAPTVVKIVS